jgi:hypothetical protein
MTKEHDRGRSPARQSKRKASRDSRRSRLGDDLINRQLQEEAKKSAEERILDNKNVAEVVAELVKQ